MKEKISCLTKKLLPVAVVIALGGCAASMPKVAYHASIPTSSPLTGRTVIVKTSVAGDQFNDEDCLTELTSKCRNVTLTKKLMVENYNKLLVQALEDEGAKIENEPPADYVIYTHMIPETGHHYMFLIDYDLGHTMAMAAIPLVGAFTPRYYTVLGHMEDVVKVTEGNRSILSKSYEVSLKKHVTGQSGFKTEYNVSGSKADNIYIGAQSQIISQMLKDVSTGGADETHQ